MATKDRCFSSVKALRRLNPELLCQVLAKFPDYLKAQRIELPKAPDLDNIPYEAIKTACMGSDVPPDLDDVLFFVCILGTTKGWERIQDEAKFQKLKLDFKPNGLTTADLAMKVWLHDWPNNKALLEQSFARSKIQSRSSYVYYPPQMDVRSRYTTPSDKTLSVLRESLSDYFVAEGLGPGTNIVKYDFEKEIWFLVRYPGHMQRHAAINEKGDPTSFVFRPEEYDAIVYHKEYGDLRLNTNRKKEHTRYRIDFAALLLNEHNVFSPTVNTVTLEPLMGDCASLFHCGDVLGLSEIVPVEVSYSSLLQPGIRVVKKADKDCHLLTYHLGGTPLLSDNSAHSIQYAKFRYRLKDSIRHDVLTVHMGNTLTYARDGDSSVLEDWLRRRDFITTMLKRRLPQMDAVA